LAASRIATVGKVVIDLPHFQPRFETMTKHAKPISPFRLEMDPDEALARFIGTKPDEVETSIAKSKKRKPPGSKPSGGSPQPEGVVDLRRRRMRKRITGK
jgi:hypothetical protein